MARKPNYSFERKERERKKAEKKAARAAKKIATQEANAEQSETNDVGGTETGQENDGTEKR